MDNIETILKVANLVQASIVVLSGFMDLSSSFFVVIQRLFMLSIGGVLFALEFTDLLLPQCQKYASFLFSFEGRGVFSIFLGTLISTEGVMSILAANYLILLGVAYIVLAFIPSINPPSNMGGRDIDGFSDGEVEGIV